MKIDLLAFYRDEIPNNKGVFLHDIWSYSDKQLESKHKYIQWMFPTDQKSLFNRAAPVLRQPEIILLKNDTIVMKNFRTSLIKIFKFYGLSLLSDDSIIISIDFNLKAKNWITPNNHNYKRISRILRFLTLFRFDKIKRELIVTLEEIYREHENAIGEETYQIWKNV